jgi:hypothetical protein
MLLTAQKPGRGSVLAALGLFYGIWLTKVAMLIKSACLFMGLKQAF